MASRSFPLEALRALALGLMLSWLLPGAGAQTMESVLAPGKLIQGHAKVEEDCAACHVRFDRAAQDKRCAECHKDIGADLRNKIGFHGRMKPQTCRTCHTEHKGRDARIAEFDKRQFDHALTDFALRGKHRSTDCAKCHVPAKAFREAASDCQGCHRKDDTHKGSLGPKCADCHTENSWKEAKFDHGTTRFALTGKHADTACGDCHRNKADYKDTPRACYGCHRKEDDSAKGHKGQYGERCDSCHGTKAWKPSTFNHDVDTKYALRGKHRTAGCADCHSGPLYKLRLAQDCASCHKKDDKHKGTLGTDCAACHTETGWKGKTRFDHDKTVFPLLGRHAEIQCDACHQSTMFKEAPKACIGCHQKDDKHAATLGERCESCHNERQWKDTRGRFDHDRTQFRLRNAHAAPKVECKACHQDLKSFRKTPLDCHSCHKKDDKHEGQLGRDCVKCHDDKTWKLGAFNHARTRFALVGRHLTVACTACHMTSRFKDAPRECVGCHDKDDKHKRVYGDDCASCHNARAWSIWDFDHDRRSGYKLDGAHRQVACEACHRRPAPEGKRIAALPGNCVFCHRKDDAHDGAFGVVCEQCHVAENWKKVSPRANRRGAAAANGGRPLAALFGESSRLSGPGGPVSPALK